MNLFEFSARFPDEASCRKAWKEFSDKQGVICKACGGRDHYWSEPVLQYQCKKCDHKTTLRSGTVMEASKPPYRYWLMEIYLLTSTKKSFSALEMQRGLGYKRYEPIWLMLHELRIVMGNRDERYKLEGPG